MNKWFPSSNAVSQRNSKTVISQRNNKVKHTILLLSLVAFAGPCRGAEMPQSAQEIGCPNCHAIDHKVVGPAWMEVSKRYRNSLNDTALFDRLVKKVSKGGQGNWGDVPMVANDPLGARQDKIKELVKFILSLSPQLPENIAK